MSQSEIPEFEELLMDKKVNNLVEFLIKDQAFSIEFLASCISQYYVLHLPPQQPSNICDKECLDRASLTPPQRKDER